MPPPVSQSARKKRAALVERFRKVAPKRPNGTFLREEILKTLNTRYLKDNPISKDTLSKLLYGKPGINVSIETAFALQEMILDSSTH